MLLIVLSEGILAMDQIIIELPEESDSVTISASGGGV